MMASIFTSQLASYSIVSIGSLLIGSLITLAIVHLKNRSMIFSIKRFYSYLPQARDVYNQISFQMDKQFSDFKMLKINLVHDKKRNAYVIVMKYKSLNGKRFSF